MNENKKKVNDDGRVKLDDEQLEKVSGGNNEYSFSDFFGDDGFDKELVKDGTPK